MATAKKLIKKIDNLWRGVLKREDASNLELRDTYDKIDLKDEVQAKSPRVDKLKKSIQARFTRNWSDKQLDRKLRDLP